MPKIDYLKILSSQRDSIPYHHMIAKILGDAVAAIFLMQVIYWYVKSDGVFYKFIAPCSHEKYREGDSWTEELKIGEWAFNSARGKVATKIKRGVKKSEVYKTKSGDGSLMPCNHIVIYWTDSNGVTFYDINEELLGEYLAIIYPKKEK